MGKVTISSEEYKRLISSKKSNPLKKKSGGSSNMNEEEKIRKDIIALREKKREISQKLSESKKGKKFIEKAGITIGAVGRIAQINKSLNEKEKVLSLYRQKKSLELQKQTANLQAETLEAKKKANDLREQQRKKLTEDIFNTKDIFKI